MKEISFKNDILPLKDRLFRLALRITLSREEAEDIVQETLIRIWNKRDEWHEIENMESFLMTICRNISLDLLEKKESRNVSLDEEIHDMADNSLSPDDLLMRQQQYQRIEKAIEELPEKQRTVVQLRDIEGKNYQEIADIMGLTLSDVKVNLFRGRQTLKQKLNKE